MNAMQSVATQFQRNFQTMSITLTQVVSNNGQRLHPRKYGNVCRSLFLQHQRRQHHNHQQQSSTLSKLRRSVSLRHNPTAFGTHRCCPSKYPLRTSYHQRLSCWTPLCGGHHHENCMNRPSLSRNPTQHQTMSFSHQPSNMSSAKPTVSSVQKPNLLNKIFLDQVNNASDPASLMELLTDGKILVLGGGNKTMLIPLLTGEQVLQDFHLIAISNKINELYQVKYGIRGHLKKSASKPKVNWFLHQTTKLISFKKGSVPQLRQPDVVLEAFANIGLDAEVDIHKRLILCAEAQKHRLSHDQICRLLFSMTRIMEKSPKFPWKRMTDLMDSARALKNEISIDDVPKLGATALSQFLWVLSSRPLSIGELVDVPNIRNFLLSHESFDTLVKADPETLTRIATVFTTPTSSTRFMAKDPINRLMNHLANFVGRRAHEFALADINLYMRALKNCARDAKVTGEMTFKGGAFPGTVAAARFSRLIANLERRREEDHTDADADDSEDEQEPETPLHLQFSDPMPTPTITDDQIKICHHLALLLERAAQQVQELTTVYKQGKITFDDFSHELSQLIVMVRQLSLRNEDLLSALGDIVLAARDDKSDIIPYLTANVYDLFARVSYNQHTNEIAEILQKLYMDDVFQDKTKIITSIMWSLAVLDQWEPETMERFLNQLNVWVGQPNQNVVSYPSRRPIKKATIDLEVVHRCLAVIVSYRSSNRLPTQKRCTLAMQTTLINLNKVKRKYAQNTSHFEDRVVKQVQEICATHKLGRISREHHVQSVHTVDAALPDNVAVEYDGPTHYCWGSTVLGGVTLLKQRQLAAMDWDLVSIPYFEYNAIASATYETSKTLWARERDYVKQKMEEVIVLPEVDFDEDEDDDEDDEDGGGDDDDNGDGGGDDAQMPVGNSKQTNKHTN